MNLTHLQSVGSTNDWLLARAADLPDSHWVITDRQTAGRGRRGRAWDDGAGNLMASVLVRAEGPVQKLSFVAAVALREAVISTTCPDTASLHARLKLKWPNDLLLDGRKLSGILLEAGGDALVIGFGVNLATAPELAANLPGLSPRDLLAALITIFADARTLWATQGFAPIRTRWLEHAAGLGAPITARLGTETLEGHFEGLQPDGALTLRLATGECRAIHAGEVFAL